MVIQGPRGCGTEARRSWSPKIPCLSPQTSKASYGDEMPLMRNILN